MKKAALRARSLFCSHPQLTPQTCQQAEETNWRRLSMSKATPKQTADLQVTPTPPCTRLETCSELSFQRTVSLSFTFVPSSLPPFLVALVSQLKKRLKQVKPVVWVWAAQHPDCTGDQKMMSEDGYKPGKRGGILPQNICHPLLRCARMYISLLTHNDFSFAKHNYSQFTTPQQCEALAEHYTVPIVAPDWWPLLALCPLRPYEALSTSCPQWAALSFF